MSRSEEYSYRLAARLRQEMFNQRVSATTETFLQRYLGQYEQMVKKGYQEYIPSEMNRLKSDLDQIRRLIIVNPVEARDISHDVGSYINSIANLGHSAIKEFELQERMNRQKLQEEMNANKSEILKYFYGAIQSINDPIVRDFAKDELEIIKNSIIFQSGQTTEELEKSKVVITTKIAAIITHATQKATEWKKRKIADNQTQSRIQQLKNVEEDLEQESIEDKEKLDKLLATIADMKQCIQSTGVAEANFQETLQTITNKIDETVISESIRREAVKAIVKSLKIQEFSVGKPQLVVSEKGNFVKIIAKKPSGKRAECIVDLEGKIKYKFDEYEGMACLKDIEKFNVDLNEIYSIQLSDQRIIWENPNKITKDARPIGNDQSRRNG